MPPVPAGGRWHSVRPAGKRGADGRLSFQPKVGSSAALREVVASFRPTLTPAEVLQAGAFGGTYFRDIKSTATGQTHKDAWKDLPASWLKGLDVSRHIARPWNDYDVSVNKYKAKCGNTLEDWEKSGWMRAQDPYGWFQWYCRFSLGRRTDDDERQIRRWAKVCGPTGRWKGNLIAKCLKQGRPYNDVSVAPAVRQSLLHWAYELSAGDMRERKPGILAGGGACFVPRDDLKDVHRKGRAAVKKRAASKASVRKRPASAASASSSASGAKRARA
mmetsp:Transcript_83560/g.240096  ORF Transcript_83560/g.240096 Transcript_83560/m.240096 type:complete len:274 (+) Transcript_83560:69-890(+)